jgi:hypothetical protein
MMGDGRTQDLKIYCKGAFEVIHLYQQPTSFDPLSGSAFINQSSSKQITGTSIESTTRTAGSATKWARTRRATPASDCYLHRGCRRQRQRAIY